MTTGGNSVWSITGSWGCSGGRSPAGRILVMLRNVDLSCRVSLSEWEVTQPDLCWKGLSVMWMTK